MREDSILQQLSEKIPDIFWVISSDQKFIYVSRAFEDIWGRRVDTLYDNPSVWMEGVDLQDKKRVKTQYQKLMKNKQNIGIEYRVIRSDGTFRHVYDRGFPILDRNGVLTHVTGITMDVTNRKKIEKRSATQYLVTQIFAESKSLEEAMPKILRMLCENFGWNFSILWMLESSTHKLNNVASWYEAGSKNESLEVIENEIILETGLSSRIMKEKQGLWIEDLKKNADLPEVRDAMGDKIRGLCGFPILAEGEFLGVMEFFSDRVLLMDESLFKFMGNIGGQIGQFAKKKYTEAQLERMAHYDMLTGLANRTVLFDVIQEGIHLAQVNDKKLAILFIDLDRFKQINDKYGHEVGDALLKIVGERLRARVRKPDTVARLGGDEFIIILSDIVKIETITMVADKILNAISKSFFVKGQEFFIATSIGISLYPEDGEDAKILLSKADIAMYEAKQQGGNKYQFCTVEMIRLANEKIELEKAMKQGLERNEFILLYQPKFDLKLKKITGVESFLYWKRDGGIVSPRDFIHLAEETGLIIQLGGWVLKTACEQTKSWQAQGFPIGVSVNLSSHQLVMGEFLGSMVDILKETQLDPQFLELEVTESLLMRNLEASVTLIHALKAMDIKISIDDFGTGFSSLMYLKQFKIDRLKIDQSFINGIPRSKGNVAIVRVIIAIAHNLGLKVIAEGVETEKQLKFLLKLGCDEMQGFYFSRPVPADELTTILKNPPDLSAFGPRS